MERVIFVWKGSIQGEEMINFIKIISIVITFTSIVIGQEVSLKGIKEMDVNIQICSELNKYLNDYSIRKTIELELMYAGIKVVENKNSNYQLLFSMICNSDKSGTAVSFFLSLAERTYLNQNKKK